MAKKGIPLIYSKINCLYRTSKGFDINLLLKEINGNSKRVDITLCEKKSSWKFKRF